MTRNCGKKCPGYGLDGDGREAECACKPMTLKDYMAKARAKKSKRKENARFIAKMKGTKSFSRRKSLIYQLDMVWSIYVKMRDIRSFDGMCRICGARPIQVGYHFIPRGSYAVRWDVENGCGACASCNFGEKNNRLKYRDIHIQILGKEKYEALETAARQKMDLSTVQLAEKLSELKSRMLKDWK